MKNEKSIIEVGPQAAELGLGNHGFVAGSLNRILKIDFQSIVDKNQIVQEALSTIESGIWPKELLDTLLKVLEGLAEEYDFGFHHFGFLQPDRETWDKATASYRDEVLRRDLHDVRNGYDHLRKYVRIKREGAQDIFLEYALLGEGGDGRLSVHFDLVHERAAELLDKVEEKLKAEANSLNATVFRTDFGGENAPTGRIGIRFDDKKTVDVGVMFRPYYSDPDVW